MFCIEWIDVCCGTNSKNMITHSPVVLKIRLIHKARLHRWDYLNSLKEPIVE